MKKTPKNSSGKASLVWRKYPYGGQYAYYKMGTIVRSKGKYMIIVSYQPLVYNAKSLNDAKNQIDKYTESKLKELGLNKSNHQIKKK